MEFLDDLPHGSRGVMPRREHTVAATGVEGQIADGQTQSADRLRAGAWLGQVSPDGIHHEAVFDGSVEQAPGDFGARRG